MSALSKYEVAKQQMDEIDNPHNYISFDKLMELCARDKAGMPPEWIVTEGVGNIHHDNGDYDVVGKVFPVIQEGDYKGMPEYDKPVVGTTRLVRISPAQFEVWCAYYERKIGQCTGCSGTGTIRWRGNEGLKNGVWKSRECWKCGGTGKPKEDQSYATVEIVDDRPIYCEVYSG